MRDVPRDVQTFYRLKIHRHKRRREGSCSQSGRRGTRGEECSLLYTTVLRQVKTGVNLGANALMLWSIKEIEGGENVGGVSPHLSFMDLFV